MIDKKRSSLFKKGGQFNFLMKCDKNAQRIRQTVYKWVLELLKEVLNVSGSTVCTLYGVYSR